MNKNNAALALFFFLNFYIITPMEEQAAWHNVTDESALNDTFMGYAENLAASFGKENFSGIYYSVIDELDRLPFQEQIEALSVMIKYVEKNRQVTKKILLIVKNRFENACKNGYQETIAPLIYEKILAPQQSSTLRLIERLTNKINPYLGSLNGYEKEKEKELDDSLEIEDKTNEFCNQIAEWWYLSEDPTIIPQLVQNLNVSFDKEIIILNKSKEKLDDPAIVSALNSYVRTLQGTLRNDCARAIGRKRSNRSTQHKSCSLARDLMVGPSENFNHSENMQHSMKHPIDEFFDFSEEDCITLMPFDDEGSCITLAQGRNIKKKKKSNEIESILEDALTARPYKIGSILAFPFKAHGLLFYCLDQKKFIESSHCFEGKNPLLVTDKFFAIPGLNNLQMAHPLDKDRFINAYCAEGESSLLTKILFSYPYFIRGFDDGSIEVADLTTQENFSFKGHNGSVTGLALLNKKILVSGSHDARGCLWNLSTKRSDGYFQCDEPIQDITVFEESIIYALIKNKILNCDPETKKVYETPFDAKGACALTSRPDGLILGFSDGVIRAIKIDNRAHSPVKVDTGITDPIEGIYCFSGDKVVVQSPHKSAILTIGL